MLHSEITQLSSAGSASLVVKNYFSFNFFMRLHYVASAWARKGSWGTMVTRKAQRGAPANLFDMMFNMLP